MSSPDVTDDEIEDGVNQLAIHQDEDEENQEYEDELDEEECEDEEDDGSSASMSVRSARIESSLPADSLAHSGSESQNVSSTFDAATAPTIDRLDEYIEQVNSTDDNVIAAGMNALRRLLSIEHNPPIDRVISTGVLPRIVALMKNSTRHQIQVRHKREKRRVW